MKFLIEIYYKNKEMYQKVIKIPLNSEIKVTKDKDMYIIKVTKDKDMYIITLSNDLDTHLYELKDEEIKGFDIRRMD